MGDWEEEEEEQEEQEEEVQGGLANYAVLLEMLMPGQAVRCSW